MTQLWGQVQPEGHVRGAVHIPAAQPSFGVQSCICVPPTQLGWQRLVGGPVGFAQQNPMPGSWQSVPSMHSRSMPIAMQNGSVDGTHWTPPGPPQQAWGGVHAPASAQGIGVGALVGPLSCSGEPESIPGLPLSKGGGWPPSMGGGTPLSGGAHAVMGWLPMLFIRFGNELHTKPDGHAAPPGVHGVEQMPPAHTAPLAHGCPEP